jgi:hypothetical protein
LVEGAPDLGELRHVRGVAHAHVQVSRPNFCTAVRSLSLQRSTDMWLPNQPDMSD